jgi:hypothetical protein
VTEVIDPLNWRKSPCLGCGDVVRRHRDAWVELGGTLSGSWMIAIEVAAYSMWTDPPVPPPAGEALYLLGVAHRHCLQLARERHRIGQLAVCGRRTEITLDQPGFGSDDLRADLPAPVGACPFCQRMTTRLTDEDVVPRWLLRELHRRGYRDRPGGSRPPRGPKTPVCADCNNGWMSVIENDTSPIILSLMDDARTISKEEQKSLALWATLKALVIDSASTRLLPRGFGHDLRMQRAPHVGMHIWIAGRIQVIMATLRSQPNR